MSRHSIAALLQRRTEALSLIKPRASPGHSSEAGVEREAWRLQARVSSLSEWMCSRQPFRLLQPHFSFTSRCHQLGQAPKRSSRSSDLNLHSDSVLVDFAWCNFLQINETLGVCSFLLWALKFSVLPSLLLFCSSLHTHSSVFHPFLPLPSSALPLSTHPC